MKRILFVLLVLVSIVCSQVAVPIRIVMPNSSYSAQLRGVSGTRTAGITIQGTYSAQMLAHVFYVTTGGRYDLYLDATGGTNYSKDSNYSGTNGKDFNNSNFADAIDTDFDNKVDVIDEGAVGSSQIADGVVSLTHMTTAAVDYIGSGGNVTNNPDDVTIIANGSSQIAVDTNKVATIAKVIDITNDSLTANIAGQSVNVRDHIEGTLGGSELGRIKKENFNLNNSYSYKNVERGKRTLFRSGIGSDIGGGMRVVFLGNSLTENVSGRLIELFKHNNGLTGLGFDPVARSRYSTEDLAMTGDGDWTANKTYNYNQPEWGIAGNSLVGYGSDTLLYSVTDIHRFTDVRVWFYDNGTSFDVGIDGENATTVSGGSTNTLRAFRIQDLDLETHDILIDSLSGDSLYLYGIETFVTGQQAGVTPYWVCQSGASAHQIASYASQYFDMFLDSVDAAITNVWLGTNDIVLGRTGNQIQTSLTTIIDSIQAVKPYMNINLFTPYQRMTGDATGIEDTDFTDSMDVVIDKIYYIARIKSCSVWDTYNYWPTVAAAWNLGLYKDKQHPSDKGNAFLAMGIMDWLNLGNANFVTKFGDSYISGMHVYGNGSSSRPSIGFSNVTGSYNTDTYSATGLYGVHSSNGIGFARAGTELMKFGANASNSSAILSFYPQATGRVNAIRIFRVGSETTYGGNITVNGSYDFVLDANNELLLQQDEDTKIEVRSNDIRVSEPMCIGDGTAPSTDASLELNDTDKAMMPNRLTTTQRDALTPSTGMFFYNTTLDSMQYYNGSSWVSF